MTGDFGLGATEDFYEVANANLLVPHKVEQSEPGVITQSLKETLYIERY